MLADGTIEPVEQQTRAARQGDLGERHAERKLEERGRSGHAFFGLRKAEKGALDFAAAIGHILRDDEQPRMGIGGEPALAPQGAGGKFEDGSAAW